MSDINYDAMKHLIDQLSSNQKQTNTIFFLPDLVEKCCNRERGRCPLVQVPACSLRRKSNCRRGIRWATVWCSWGPARPQCRRRFRSKFPSREWTATRFSRSASRRRRWVKCLRLAERLLTLCWRTRRGAPPGAGSPGSAEDSTTSSWCSLASPLTWDCSRLWHLGRSSWSSGSFRTSRFLARRCAGLQLSMAVTAAAPSALPPAPNHPSRCSFVVSLWAAKRTDN